MNEIRTGTLNGHRAITLENDLLRVTILPDKGADIAELIHKPSGVDCLAKTPWGLKPPGAAPATDFLDNYEGGWQEMFPSSNDACEVRGQAIPFHGETPLLPWEVEILAEVGDEIAVRLSVQSRALPLRLERTMRLASGGAGADVGGMRPQPGRRAGSVHLGPPLRSGRALSGRRVLAGDAGRRHHQP